MDDKLYYYFVILFLLRFQTILTIDMQNCENELVVLHALILGQYFFGFEIW